MKANWNERIYTDDFQFGTSLNNFSKLLIDRFKFRLI